LFLSIFVGTFASLNTEPSLSNASTLLTLPRSSRSNDTAPSPVATLCHVTMRGIRRTFMSAHESPRTRFGRSHPDAPAQSRRRIHPDRVVGSHRHHRDSRRDAAACPRQGQGQGQTNRLSEQSTTSWACPRDV